MAEHLTFEERKLLARLVDQRKPIPEVARLMGRHGSTIRRELKRNSTPDGYEPAEAQRLAEARRLSCRRTLLMDDEDVESYVVSGLLREWSPDQIAGRARRDFPGRTGRYPSRQTIYNWIHTRAPGWKRCLRRGGRPAEKRGKLPDCVRIDGRPDIINRRLRYGDWEGDTIVGKHRASALVTLVERKSGYTRIGRVDDLKAATTSRVAIRRMKDLPGSLRRSATFDNGKEFADHVRIGRALGLEIYFAKPYRSWQRGTNENTNGLLRQYFPKGTDFRRVSHHEVARVEKQLNERPRKRLDYRTPTEVLEPYRWCD